MKSVVMTLVFSISVLSFSRAATFYKTWSGTPAVQTHYEHTIPVQDTSNSTTGKCADISTLLEQAHTYKHSVLLQLGEGCFNLTSNELANFSGWTDFAIIGQGKGISTLTCAEGVGLTFLSSVRVTLQGVTIRGCGRVQTSTSKNYSSDSERLSYIEFWVGLYFLSCGSVVMDHVTVTISQGVGVVMYNCNGTNVFNCSEFKTNFARTDGRLGNGGMAIEFSFCQPGDTSCKSSEASSVQVTRSNYTFSNCTFEYNDPLWHAPPASFVVPVLYPHGTEHLAFDKGGGLSVIFKGRSTMNSINIESCTFKDNAAHWGGGLYTSFGDQSIENTLTVSKSKFLFNVNSCYGTSTEWRRSGGGAQIDFFYHPPDDEVWPGYQPNVVRNSVKFSNTVFANNLACWGGAVSVIVSRESPGKSATNSILFDGCHFKYNQARIGAAVDVSLFQPDSITGSGTLMAPVFKDCLFSENSITYTQATNYQIVTGAVYANDVPLNFTGTTNFSANSGTALTVSGTYVLLSESSDMPFDSNIGRHGGALSFLGNSWLVAHKNAHVVFQNNSADSLGGAVYSAHFGEHDLIYKQNCFFRYYEATLPPSKWNASFTFTGNLAKGERNSIYTTSLLPCVWPNMSETKPDMSSTFCGHPWIYDTGTSCKEELATGPSNINNTASGVPSISAVPGWKEEIPIQIFNDLGSEINAVYTAVPYGYNDHNTIAVSNTTQYISDNTIVIHGVVNNSAKLLLRTLDPKVISSLLRVDIQDCPPGYTRQYCTDNPTMVCDCICTYSLPGVGCNNKSHDVEVYRYNCLTKWYENENHTLVSGRCPYNPFYVKLNSSKDFNETEICGKLNRNGTLCSSCEDDYGVNVNSYNFPCVKCDQRYHWIFYILVELIPIIIFFMIVALFKFSATCAAMNAFVFFSQAITIPYFHNPYSFTFGIMLQKGHKVLEAFISIPYGIWNLDFFTTSLIPGFCLDHHLRTIDVILLKYINALFPLLLIAVCYVLIELHDRNYRSIRFAWRPFNCCLKMIYKDREPKKSIIDVFATFLLLSYTKIMYVSFSLFAPTHLNDASGSTYKLHTVYFYFDASQEMFSGKRAVLIIIAVVMLAVFVILPPVILLLYPTKCFQIILDKLPFKIVLRTFAEAFNGDFKDGTLKEGKARVSDCRLFAGFYFLIRFVVFIILVIQLTWLEQYFIQQILYVVCLFVIAVVKPYKVHFYNRLDTAFFLLMSILNACSLYNSQRYIGGHISKAVFWINYFLALLPLVYITGYLVYLFLLWKGFLNKRTKLESPVSEGGMLITDSNSVNDSEHSERSTYNSRDEDEDYPDRLLNPQNYNARNLYRPHDENAGSLSRQQRMRQGSSEKSYFNDRRDPHVVPYGTVGRLERHTEPIIRHGTSGRRSNTDATRSSGSSSSVQFQRVV